MSLTPEERIKNAAFLRTLPIGSNPYALAAFSTFAPLNTGDVDNVHLHPSNFNVEVCYGCCISEPKGKNGYSISYTEDKKKCAKRFGFSKYGGKELAKVAALQFKSEKSDSLGLTETYRTMKIIPDGLQSFLACFVDGDGCILWDNGLSVTVVQTSCNDEPPNSLLAFQTCFGGTLRCVGIPEGMEIKPKWDWRIHGKRTKPLLEILAKRAIVKAPQAILGLEGINLNTKVDNTNMCVPAADKKRLTAAIVAAKKNYQSVPIDDSKLSAEYAAGFFDAEGCIMVREKVDTCDFEMKFAQLCCTALLERLKIKLGDIGTVAHGCLRLSGENCILGLKIIQPHLLEKRLQCDIAISHRVVVKSRERHKRTEEDKAEDAEADKRCKALKRYHGKLSPVATGASSTVD